MGRRCFVATWLAVVGGYIVKGGDDASRPINFEVESAFSCLEPVNDILPCLWYLENTGVPSVNTERPLPWRQHYGTSPASMPLLK